MAPPQSWVSSQFCHASVLYVYRSHSLIPVIFRPKKIYIHNKVLQKKSFTRLDQRSYKRDPGMGVLANEILRILLFRSEIQSTRYANNVQTTQSHNKTKSFIVRSLLCLLFSIYFFFTLSMIEEGAKIIKVWRILTLSLHPSHTVTGHDALFCSGKHPTNV